MASLAVQRATEGIGPQMKRYHAFWENPYGHERQYKAFDDEAGVLELVAASEVEDSDVRGLSVIWGELLEFEPYERVKSYRVKAVKE